MDSRELASIITQVILSVSSFLMLLFKYREVFDFFLKLSRWAVAPIKYCIEWIGLARKLEAKMAENKQSIASGRKEIEDVRQSIESLSRFVKERLSSNGGSSPIDAIARIENRQIATEARQNALLDNSRSGVFFCDLDGKNIWVNRTFARFLGCGVLELLGFGWKQFISSDELERYSKVWMAAFADHCGFENTVQFTNAYRQKVALHVEVAAVKNEQGIVQSYIGQVTAL